MSFIKDNLSHGHPVRALLLAIFWRGLFFNIPFSSQKTVSSRGILMKIINTTHCHGTKEKRRKFEGKGEHF